ncbi:hypothetical protein QUA56_35015, partial [Microcoleus sp. N3A4]
VIGYWLLVIGYWLLVIGYWLLVIGYTVVIVGGALRTLAIPGLISAIAFLRSVVFAMYSV